MEKIRDIWRQEKISTVFPEIFDVSPVGRAVDVVFTSNRLALVATDERNNSPSWGVGAVAGPLGLIVTGALSSLWSAYQSFSKDREIDPELLNQLVESGLAISADADSLVCEVNEVKKSFIDYLAIVPDSDSRIALYGKYKHKDSYLDGAIWTIKNWSAAKAKRTIQSNLPIDVVIGKKFELSEPSSVEIRVLGRDLNEFRRQRYQSQK